MPAKAPRKTTPRAGQAGTTTRLRAPTEEQKKKAKDTVARRLTLPGERLSHAELVVGDDFSVVDASLFVMPCWAEQQGIAVPAALTRYAERLRTRPSVRAALSQEGLPAAE